MFGQTYYSQTRAAEQWRHMQEHLQQPSENMAAYFHAKVCLCRDAHLDFCDTREQVLTSLQSRELCTMLLWSLHEDQDDLLHDIQEFERIDHGRRERFSAATGSSPHRRPALRGRASAG